MTRNESGDLRYLVPDHLAYLARRLTLAIAGVGKRRLIVSMPPRHGKSELISNWTPTWFLHNFPHKRVMLGAYNGDFAKQWGRKVRNNIEAYGADLAVRMSSDSTSVEHWHTTAGGGMMARGLGGAFTGFGGDLLICDDPIKALAEANSAANRDFVWGWWTSAFMTRVEPSATVILTMTRWHVDDLVGRILDDPQQSHLWDVIEVPALAEKGDLLGRAEGEALWPERKSREMLLAEEMSVGPYVWDALYRQKPPNLNGGGAYYNFKHGNWSFSEGNVDDTAALVNDIPLDLSIDFNKQPGSHAIIGQYLRAGDQVTAFHELHTPNGVAKHIAQAFIQWWRQTQPQVPFVNVFGDASGGAGVMTDGKTAWSVVVEEFANAGIPHKLRVPAKNPGVFNRVESVNNALLNSRGERRYRIHSSCKRLIRDFQKVTWDAGHLNKTNVELTHISDADGYRVAILLPIS